MAAGKENEVEPKKDEKMKTQRMILAALCGVSMLIGTSSCKKEKQENENEGEMMRIEVSVGGTDGNTKTHLVHGEHSYKVAWDNTDAFMLYTIDGTNGSNFRFSELTEGSDGTTAIFEGHRPGAAPFYGCYPSGKVSCEDAGVYEFTIDETQAGNPETVGVQTATANAGPMVGYMKDAESGMAFQNVMSWLKVGLKGNAIIKRVTLADKDGMKLNGTLKVICNVDEHGEFSFTSAMDPGTGTNQLEIVSNEGFQLNSTNPTYFWFQVPAGSLKNLELDAYLDVDGLAKVLELSKTISDGVGGNTVLTAEVNSSITATEAEVTTAVGCSNENIYQLKVTVTGKDANFTTYMVGVCYNYADSEDPTIGHCIGYQEIGTFTIANGSTKDINYDFAGLDLEDNKHYKICAYATNGIYAHSTNCVEIDGGNVPQPLPDEWIANGGKNPHPFTVASGKQVYFSQGNLQYNATGSNATAASGANVGGTWRFAEHQFDIIGAGNANAAQTYDGWIDVFGWGTSGYNHGAVCYQPWSTSETYTDYIAYDTPGYNLFDGSGMADWGYNTIQTGGTNSWRTLTKDEWRYLIESRNDGSGNVLYGEGKVGPCMTGLIVLPDDWDWSEVHLSSSAPIWIPGSVSYSNNNYNYTDWALMEAFGAVFLPAAGSRSGASMRNVGSVGYYQSSTYNNDDYAWYFRIDNTNVDPRSPYGYLYHGFSVRLVSEN